MAICRALAIRSDVRHGQEVIPLVQGIDCIHLLGSDRVTSGMSVDALAAALHSDLDFQSFLIRGPSSRFRGIGCPEISNSASRGLVGPARL